MALYHNTIDQFRASRYEYECTACGKRLSSEVTMAACPSCSELLRNLSVPRE